MWYMDIFEWFRKNKLKSFLLAIVLFFLVPFGIDKAFEIPAIIPLLSVQYQSTDILSFYGTILGSTATILALVETIQHTEKLHSLDYERQLTPLLDSNIYNHSDSSICPHRMLYVNVKPAAYLDKISVLSSVDSRDLDDLFFGTQIDYLIQNISTTSAVDIKVYLNDQLLCGPFSLVPDSEVSVGIFFFDKKGRMISEYPEHFSFHILVTYTNGIRSKRFVQEEYLSIRPIFMSTCGDPPFMPNYDLRTGLSTQRIISP